MKYFQFTIVGVRKMADVVTTEEAARAVAEEMRDVLGGIYVVLATEVSDEKSSFVKVGGVKEWKHE